MPILILSARSGQWKRMALPIQVHYAQRMITQKCPPYLNRFQFDAVILALATPRQRRLLGEHKPS